MFEAQGNRRGQAKAIHNQGETYLRQQRGAEAGILYERAIALALDAGDEVSAVRPRTSLAILLHQQGQHEAALALHREIEIVYRRLGDRPMLARVINNEGAFLLALGRRDDATRAYEQAAHMHLESGNLGDAAVSLLNWAEILLDRGDAEQAQTRLGQAGELLGALPDSPVTCAPVLCGVAGAGDGRACAPYKRRHAKESICSRCSLVQTVSSAAARSARLAHGFRPAPGDLLVLRLLGVGASGRDCGRRRQDRQYNGGQ